MVMAYGACPSGPVKGMLSSKVISLTSLSRFYLSKSFFISPPIFISPFLTPESSFIGEEVSSGASSPFKVMGRGVSSPTERLFPPFPGELAIELLTEWRSTHLTPFRLHWDLRLLICSANDAFASFSSSIVTSYALTKVFLMMVSSFTRTPFWVRPFKATWPFKGMWIGISSQVSLPLAKPLFIRRSYHVYTCYRKLALISRLGRLEVTNSSDFISDQLNFIMK